jgi:hypothetical protein
VVIDERKSNSKCKAKRTDALAVGEARGMTFRPFTADFGGRQVRVATYEEPDGKLEQYLVIAPGTRADE